MSGAVARPPGLSADFAGRVSVLVHNPPRGADQQGRDDSAGHEDREDACRAHFTPSTVRMLSTTCRVWPTVSEMEPSNSLGTSSSCTWNSTIDAP